MTQNTCVSPQVSRGIRVMVADRNLMSAQMLAQVLSQDPRFRVTLVSTAGQMMTAGARFDVGVVNADLVGSMDETMRTTSSFSERYPHVRLILLMDAPSRELVVDAFRCGASGVFSRNQPVDDFLKCVDRVSQGEIWASRSEIDHLLSALRSTPVSRMIGCGEIDVLTKRELEVVRQACQGLANKEIAEKLGLSEHTVKNYLFRVFDKIGVSSRVELLFYLLHHEKPVSEENIANTNDLTTDHHRAAENGFVTAQFSVGMAYHHGEGIERNPVSAYFWLTLAQQSAEEIFLQSRETLEQLRKTMTLDEIQKAERSLVSHKSSSAKTKNLLSFVNNGQNARPTLMA